MKSVLAALLLALPAFPATAAELTVTLSVPGMTCAACPITVKKALSRVPGVRQVEVAYEQREVAVTFDDAESGVPALIEATKNAGYPATVKE